MYASAINRVQPILTNSKLQLIMDVMKSSWREEEYADALGNSSAPQMGILQRSLNRFWNGILVCDCLWRGYYCGCAVIERNMREPEYTLVVYQKLSKIDRDKELVLTRKHKCTSCSICLEYFQLDKNSIQKGKYIESNGKPVHMLKCGYTFDATCWIDWISKGSVAFNVRHYPICQDDINRSLLPPTSPSSGMQPLTRDRKISSNTSNNGNRRDVKQQINMYNNGLNIWRQSYQF